MNKSDKSDQGTTFWSAVAPRVTQNQAVLNDSPKVERLSTIRAKQEFVRVYGKIGGSNITLVTNKVGISRDTYYRWMKEDPDFRSRIEYAYQFVNDLVEDMLMLKILQGHAPSIRFFLSRRHPKYMRKKLVQCRHEAEQTWEDLFLPSSGTQD